MNFYDNDEMPYRKKSKGKHIKKSNHKHHFEPCVFEYGIKRFDKQHGYIPTKKASIGSYCSICGKVNIGAQYKSNKWIQINSQNAYCLWYENTEDAKRELDESTRTLPTFHLDDYFSQKYVEVN